MRRAVQTEIFKISCINIIGQRSLIVIDFSSLINTCYYDVGGFLTI